MRTKAIIPFFGCALLLAVSCDVKDPIYNTPHPDHGTVTPYRRLVAAGHGHRHPRVLHGAGGRLLDHARQHDKPDRPPVRAGNILYLYL